MIEQTALARLLQERRESEIANAGDRARFSRLLEPSGASALAAAASTDWVNFYRRDDVSATAYFYLDRPGSNLPPLAPVDERVAGLK